MGVPGLRIWGPRVGVLGSHVVNPPPPPRTRRVVLGVPRVGFWGPLGSGGLGSCESQVRGSWGSQGRGFGVPWGQEVWGLAHPRSRSPGGPRAEDLGSQVWGFGVPWGQEVWGLVSPRSGAPEGPRLGAFWVPRDEVPPQTCGVVVRVPGLRIWGPRAGGLGVRRFGVS